MKKILSLLLVLTTLVLSLVACGGTEEGVPTGFKKASNDDACSYTLYVPDFWTVTSGSPTDYTMATAADGVSVSMAVVKQVGDATTVGEYWEDCQEEYARLFEDFTPDAENQGTELTVGGAYGTRYLFSAKYNGVEYRYMQVYIVHADSLLSGSRLYIFTFAAKASAFDAYYDNEQNLDVLAILSHFKFD